MGSTTRRCFTHQQPNLLSAWRFILFDEATGKTTSSVQNYCWPILSSQCLVLQDTLAIWLNFLWIFFLSEATFLFVFVFSFSFYLVLFADSGSGFSVTKLLTSGQASLVLSHIFWSCGALPPCYCYGGTATVLMDGRRQKFTSSIMHAWPTS